MSHDLSVGFVGLGNIGKPMAQRLASGAHELTVYDVMDEPVAELVAQGAKRAESVAELAGQVDVLCVMVRDDDQVRDVLGEALGALKPGSVFVVHSTIAPDTPRQLEVTASRHDVLVLDAPVSGGPMGAIEGTLAIMVGGSEAAYDRALPVLERMGTKVVRAGGIGAGTQFKLARNMMHFASFVTAHEAMRLAEAAGLSVKDLGEVVRHTDKITGGPGAIMLRDTTAPIAEDDFWHGVMTHVHALGDKDLGFALELADRLGVDVPLARQAKDNLKKELGL